MAEQLTPESFYNTCRDALLGVERRLWNDARYVWQDVDLPMLNDPSRIVPATARLSNYAYQDTEGWGLYAGKGTAEQCLAYETGLLEDGDAPLDLQFKLPKGTSAVVTTYIMFRPAAIDSDPYHQETYCLYRYPGEQGPVIPRRQWLKHVIIMTTHGDVPSRELVPNPATNPQLVVVYNALCARLGK